MNFVNEAVLWLIASAESLPNPSANPLKAPEVLDVASLQKWMSASVWTLLGLNLLALALFLSSLILPQIKSWTLLFAEKLAEAREAKRTQREQSDAKRALEAAQKSTNTSSSGAISEDQAAQGLSQAATTGIENLPPPPSMDAADATADTTVAEAPTEATESSPVAEASEPAPQEPVDSSTEAVQAAIAAAALESENTEAAVDPNNQTEILSQEVEASPEATNDVTEIAAAPVETEESSTPAEPAPEVEAASIDASPEAISHLNSLTPPPADRAEERLAALADALDAPLPDEPAASEAAKDPAMTDITVMLKETSDLSAGAPPVDPTEELSVFDATELDQPDLSNRRNRRRSVGKSDKENLDTK